MLYCAILRLILSGWRGLNDNLIMPAVLTCKELTQLDLLGIKNISADVCEKALLLLPKLRLLDISFCNSIRQDEVRLPINQVFFGWFWIALFNALTLLKKIQNHRQNSPDTIGSFNFDLFFWDFRWKFGGSSTPTLQSKGAVSI